MCIQASFFLYVYYCLIVCVQLIRRLWLIVKVSITMLRRAEVTRGDNCPCVQRVSESITKYERPYLTTNYVSK